MAGALQRQYSVAARWCSNHNDNPAKGNKNAFFRLTPKQSESLKSTHDIVVPRYNLKELNPSRMSENLSLVLVAYARREEDTKLIVS